MRNIIPLISSGFLDKQMCRECQCLSCLHIHHCDICRCNICNEDDTPMNNCKLFINKDETGYTATDASIDSACRQNSYASTIFTKEKDDLKDLIKKRDREYFKDKTELNSHQTARQDEIENSVFKMIKIITCNPELEWNMEIIGDVTSAVCDVLTEKGFFIYYPSTTIDESFKETISNFYNV